MANASLASRANSVDLPLWGSRTASSCGVIAQTALGTTIHGLSSIGRLASQLVVCNRCFDIESRSGIGSMA